jgi:hypothetical protein
MPLQEVTGRDVSVQKREADIEHGRDENQVWVEGGFLQEPFTGMEVM